MNKELTTAITTAIIGILVAYFACDLLIGPIEGISFKTIDSSVNMDIKNPNPEVFNYKALNPTVEVYVGSCAEYNDNGDCVEVTTEEDIVSSDAVLPDQTNQQNQANQTDDSKQENQGSQ